MVAFRDALLNLESTDEILYHSRVHPEQKCHTLSEEEVAALHTKTVYVCQTAVSVNADASKFPDNWLFWHRWGKGKSRKGKEKLASALMLPSGEPATIKWLTVGGRTSAYVVELQKSTGKGTVVAVTEADNSDLSDLTDLEEEEVVAVRKQPKRTAPRKDKDEPRRETKRRKSSKT